MYILAGEFTRRGKYDICTVYIGDIHKYFMRQSTIVINFHHRLRSCRRCRVKSKRGRKRVGNSRQGEHTEGEYMT
jgi:hypothetical protein